MLRLLVTERRLRWFLVGGILITLGGSASLVALPLFILNTTHNAFLLGIILLARTLPVTLLAPFFGRYIDRVGMYRTTITGLLLSACGVAAIPFLQGLPLLIIISAFIQGIGQILLFPVVAFYLPVLVSERELDRANSLFRTLSIVGGLAGTALGGLLITYQWYTLTFVLDALLSIFALGTVLAIGKIAGERAQDENVSLWKAFAPVVQLVRRDRTLLHMLIIDAALYFALGAVGVALPVYTTALAHAPWLYSGALIAANVAELCGGIAAPSINRRIPPGRLAFSYGIFALVMALSFLGISLWLSVASVLLFTFITSFMLGVLYVLYGAYMQKTVPEYMMGRFQTIAASLSSICQSGGNFIAGEVATFSSNLGYAVIGGVVLMGSMFILIFQKEKTTDGSNEEEPREELLVP